MKPVSVEAPPCVKCRVPTDGIVPHSDIFIPICRSCGEAWSGSPERKRLSAISKSVFSEWIERERCEALAEKLANAAQEDVSKTSEDT